MAEYAFDLKLRAVVRVEAEDLDRALASIQRTIDCVDAYLEVHDPVTGARLVITETSHDHAPEDPPRLFEVDGRDVEVAGTS